MLVSINLVVPFSPQFTQADSISVVGFSGLRSKNKTLSSFCWLVLLMVYKLFWTMQNTALSGGVLFAPRGGIHQGRGEFYWNTRHWSTPCVREFAQKNSLIGLGFLFRMRVFYCTIWLTPEIFSITTLWATNTYLAEELCNLNHKSLHLANHCEYVIPSISIQSTKCWAGWLHQSLTSCWILSQFSVPDWIFCNVLSRTGNHCPSCISSNFLTCYSTCSSWSWWLGTKK